MRITPEQISTIVDTTHRIAGPDANVWLFGSRLDDARRGGDLDLLIESVPVASFLERSRLKNRLEHLLQLPVDVLATGLGESDSPFVVIARANAVKLNDPQHTRHHD